MLPPRPPARLGHRIKLSATLITLLGLLILTVPVIVLTGSLVDSCMDLATNLAEEYGAGIAATLAGSGMAIGG